MNKAKIDSPILSHTNFSFRVGQINQLILLVDTQFLGMYDCAVLFFSPCFELHQACN